MKLSVVVPVYNEEQTLETIAARILAAAPAEREVLLINDGSTDRSPALCAALAAKHPEVLVFDQPRNRGKGAAIRRGFGEATGEIILVQDADLEYDPADYAALIQPILDGRADVVYGSRFMHRPRKVDAFAHAQGNRVLTVASNLLTGLNLTDMETCYKVFRAPVIKALNLESDRFGIEPEMTAKISRIPGISIYEVPIGYHYRPYSEGKKITWKDGVSAFWRIARYNLMADPSRDYKVPPEEIPVLSRS